MRRSVARTAPPGRTTSKDASFSSRWNATSPASSGAASESGVPGVQRSTSSRWATVLA
ncbi:hypothetical protein AB0N29_15115 [Nocardioides sp. NPDC092400]|uniref:hypothetical protein n=1 Tax=Nocardioides sp. NPDC092400 TaxID=3155196 RepID=UPI003416FCF5